MPRLSESHAEAAVDIEQRVEKTAGGVVDDRTSVTDLGMVSPRRSSVPLPNNFLHREAYRKQLAVGVARAGDHQAAMRL